MSALGWNSAGARIGILRNQCGGRSGGTRVSMRLPRVPHETFVCVTFWTMNQLHPTSGVHCTPRPCKRTRGNRRDAETRGDAPRCRVCANDDLRTILDLGRLPLANALLTGG